MKNFIRSAAMTIFSLTLSGVLFGADIKAPIDLSSAKVLPKGVRNLRYKGILIEGNEKFNNMGNTEVLADPFFKNLTWQDILDPKVDAAGKGTLQGYLEAKGFDLNEKVGDTTGALSVAATGHVPVLAYGFTSKITTAVAVPIIKYAFNVDTGFKTTQNLEKLDASLKEDKKTFEREELHEKMGDPISTKSNDFGYKPLESEQGTKLGDIKLVTKYNLSSKPLYTLSVQNEVTAPTGDKPDLDKVVDVAPGDGQWDVGFTLLTDFYPTDRLTLTTSLNYTFQLPDHTVKRVPYRSDSSLSPEIDRDVKRDLGDQALGQLGAKYELLKGFVLTSGYSFQIKDKDRYSGKAFSSERYVWMEAKTRQRMHAAQVGLGYSTLRLFQEKSFPVPLEANLNYSVVMAGKNVTTDPTTSFEFVMFF